jgi:hypothetical protein
MFRESLKKELQKHKGNIIGNTRVIHLRMSFPASASSSSLPCKGSEEFCTKTLAFLVEERQWEESWKSEDMDATLEVISG